MCKIIRKDKKDMALASRVKAEKAAEKQKILESMTEEELAKLEYDN